ncbi:MAG: 5-formyltetrahydrofolate cyclo-ligase [Bauldia sp.]
MTTIKETLRGAALSRRDCLAEAERAEKSERVRSRVAAILAGTPPLSLAGYQAIRSEVDITPLLETLRSSGVRISLPAISGGSIVFREWRAGQPLVRSAFGLHEPAPDAPGATPETLLVPMLAFDRKGYRLGYGKGHYDRAIAALRAAGFAPRLIGVAFAVQEVPDIPAESFDVRLDVIVTEDEVLRFGEERAS